MVEVAGLGVTYRQANGAVVALRDLSFTVARGETCAVIGPSGCGKTTLLYVLAGLLAPSAGAVNVAGVRVAGPRARTALVLQDYGLLPWLSVWDNAALGLRVRGAAPFSARDAVRPVLAELGLWEYRGLYPAQLSGGMRQRVAVARALALNPDLLLMDEPLSSLDAPTREDLQERLLGIWRARGTTMVVVTHNIEEAVYLGRQVLVLSARPGRVVHRLDNPGVGDPRYRGRPAFFRRALEVRAALADVMARGA